MRANPGYCEEIRVFKAGISLNISAWNMRDLFLFGEGRELVKRYSGGHSYSLVRGEILRFREDALRRKPLPTMLLLIKNES